MQELDPCLSPLVPHADHVPLIGRVEIVSAEPKSKGGAPDPQVLLHERERWDRATLSIEEWAFELLLQDLHAHMRCLMRALG